MDNEEAEINVVRNIPYYSKIEVTGTTNTVPLQNIEYKDVGIKLRITPRISKERMVQLDINQEISDTVGRVESGLTLTPETYKRETKTKVLVRDNHTIVIGGLVSDDVSESMDKIPILGDIPLIGNLFRTRSTRNRKTNLLVFITPRVVSTAQQVADLTRLKRHEMSEIENRLSEKEMERAEKEQALREEEAIRIRQLRERYALLTGTLLAPAEKQKPEEIAPPTPPTLPIPPFPERKKGGGITSILEGIPRVSFGRTDEPSGRSRATGRYHR